LSSFVVSEIRFEANVASLTLQEQYQITATMFGLLILDNNTSDVKPISTATQSALDLKKPLDSISL
jgi:hypothetical protein